MGRTTKIEKVVQNTKEVEIPVKPKTFSDSVNLKISNKITELRNAEDEDYSRVFGPMYDNFMSAWDAQEEHPAFIKNLGRNASLTGWILYYTNLDEFTLWLEYNKETKEVNFPSPLNLPSSGITDYSNSLNCIEKKFTFEHKEVEKDPRTKEELISEVEAIKKIRCPDRYDKLNIKHINDLLSCM